MTSYFSHSPATASSGRDDRLVDVLLVVRLQRGAQVLADADVVDDQAAGLVAEHAVDAGDRLQQPVVAHRLVDVERVQHGRVEPGQPHVLDDHHAQRVVGVLEAFGELLELGL